MQSQKCWYEDNAMSKAALVSEMQKFRFGSKVVCSDGEYGTLAQVVFDSSTRCMTHINVKQGRLFGKTVLLPFDTITSAGSDGIVLRIASEDVEAASHTAGEMKGALLSNKCIVERAGTASRGTLALVAVQPGSGELAYLVAHHLLPRQDTLLRAEFVTALATEHITVSVAGVVGVAGTTPGALPPYRPDDVLQQEVESILFDFTPLHIDLKGMNIRVLDGVLYLDGNISSSLRGDIVVDQVSSVAGLLEIKNNLIGDDKLAADLAAALGKDPRTRDLPIGVYPRLGVVRLNGTVQSVQQKAAAEEIARNFPGVRSVINELNVDPKADILLVMAPSGGNEDKVPNKYTRHTK
jgi:osmotically-inducible protein OsmY/sporulation protein YlmC with PRC-barrel domain